MTVNLPPKAGYVVTPAEWNALVRIAENLGAQVIQRDAALRQAEAERDDAQAVARAYILRAEAAENKMLREMMDVDVVIAVMAERDAARAEAARLTAALERGHVAWENFKIVMAFDVSDFSEADAYYYEELDAALRGQPAPARGGTRIVSLNSLNECDGCGHFMVDHDRADDGRRVCMRLGCKCIEPAPAKE